MAPLLLQQQSPRKGQCDHREWICCGAGWGWQFHRGGVTSICSHQRAGEKATTL